MNEDNKIRISLVEDNTGIRETLKLLIDGTNGLICCCDYSNAEDAIINLPVKKPDIILMDINLPGKSGIQCIQELKPKMPNSNFVILTMYEDSEMVFEALKSGAVGYMLKRTSPDKLIEAIMEAHNGGSPMSMQIARMVVRSFSNSKEKLENEYSLTNREGEILRCLTKGMRYKEIAGELCISVETVRSHLRKIYEKLQVRSATEAVIKYLTDK